MRAAISRYWTHFALAALFASVLPACAASTSLDEAPAETSARQLGDEPEATARSPLAEVLAERNPPAQLEALPLRSGCTPALCGPDQVENYDEPTPPGCTPMYCSVQVDRVEWIGDAQELRIIGGEHIDLVNAGVGPALELADQPFAAARVGTAESPWGVCLALSHAGLGQSGRSQRWITLVLVPYANGEPGRSATRLTGAWASCEDLQQGADADEVLLPLVEPSAEGDAGLLLQRYRCSLQGCRRDAEAKPVRVEFNEDGELHRRE